MGPSLDANVYGTTTTFPNDSLDSIRRWASASASSGKTRSTVARRCPASNRSPRSRLNAVVAAAFSSAQIERGGRARDKTYEHQSTSQCERRDASRRVRAANEVEHHVEAIGSPLRRRLCELTGAREDRATFEAVWHRPFDLVGRARRAKRNRADGSGDLNSGEPDSASHRVDQDTLTWRKLRL